MISTQNLGTKKLYVYTDSKYLIDSITKYAIDWEKNDSIKIWSFGPNSDGPNMLEDATKGV